VLENSLSTTNVLLGIMAAVSVLEAVVLVGVSVAAFIVYRRVTELVRAAEFRHIAPAMMRLDAILDDVKDVTAKIRGETKHFDQAIRSTIHHMDSTADRVQSNVRAKAGRIVSILRGVRTALEQLFTSSGKGREPWWN
jgi:hypothetical protein